jgi:hypothetical protein
LNGGTSAIGREREPTLGDLCEKHDAAKQAVDEAFGVVQERFLGSGSGRGRGLSSPSAKDLARLEDARAKREVIERQMDEFMTTRR